MSIDVHITTCHHTSVKCRDRQGLPPWSNIKSWTPEERLNISKISIESIKNFVKTSITDYKLFLLDDGSNTEDSKSWLNSLSDINVKSFPHRGSSSVINDHFSTIDSQYVFHIEDDHILFNPKSLNLNDICNKILDIEDIKVISLRSGLPSRKESPGINGDWGPRGFKIINDIPCIIYNRLGNSQHIMSKKTYSEFFPMVGNTGGCEDYLNRVMRNKGYKNVEIQLPIYAFHSHTLSYPISIPNSDEWNRSGDGFEYGIEDMDRYLKSKQEFTCTYYKQYPNEKVEEVLLNYNYD